MGSVLATGNVGLDVLAETETRDWVDYVTLAFAALVAVGTIGAVLVALFGPRWRARERLPRLWAESQPASVTRPHPLTSVSAFSFELGNEAGRETARDVEIFLTYDRLIRGPELLPLAEAITLPANFSRPVTLLLLGTADAIRAETGAAPADDASTEHETVAFAVSGGRGPQWLNPDQHEVSIYVTGSNFDAIRFDGALQVTREPRGDHVVQTSVSWEEPLRAVPMDAAPGGGSPLPESFRLR